MINAAAIVEQTAEIFVSRALPMVPPFSGKYEAHYFVGLTSGEAEGLWRHPLSCKPIPSACPT